MISTDPRIAVVGAGTGALTQVNELERRRLALDTHKQPRRLREVGAGVILPANATRVYIDRCRVEKPHVRSWDEINELISRDWWADEVSRRQRARLLDAVIGGGDSALRSKMSCPSQ